MRIKHYTIRRGKKLSLIGSLISAISVTLCLGQNYCIPSFSYQDEYIDNFAISTMVNNYSGVNNSGYILYPDSIFSTSLNIGSHYPITVSGDFPAGSQGKFAAWIDFNNDGNFDSLERIHYDTSMQYSTSGIVTIPNDTSILGNRRLRVLQCSGLSPISPCGPFVSGEAEDYTVNITTNQPDSLIYCTPFHSANYDNFIINDFSLNTLVNFESGSNETNYILYPETSFTTELHLGCTYNVFVAKYLWFYGITGGFALWIDLNNDGILAETERLFYTSDTVSHASGVVTIPDDTSCIGKHRLRVRSSWGYAETNPCSLVAQGETEDYTITISSIPTSIPDKEDDFMNTVVVYPNPTQNMLFISFKSAYVKNMDIGLYNLLGQEIKIKSVPCIEKNKVSLDVSFLPKGLYLVICSTNQIKKWFKVYKN